jgi:hypothetical protein
MNDLPEAIDGLPNLCGWDQARAAATRRGRDRSVFLDESGIDFARARGACAVALHMHQPIIPAGGPGRGSEASREPLIGNLQYMLESPYEEDRHNAGVYRWCYRRAAEFIPQLVAEGRQPRLTLDYTGTLLHGLQQMGARDVLDAALAVTGGKRPVDVLGTTENVDLASCFTPGGFRAVVVNHGSDPIEVVLVPLGVNKAGSWTDLVTGARKPGRTPDGALAVTIPARSYVCWEYKSGAMGSNPWLLKE